jgi:hypothetical protein
MPSIPSFARFRTKVVRVQASKGMTVQMMHQRSTLALLETKFKLKASTDEDRVALARSGHSSYPKHVEEVAMTALSARLAEKKKPDIVNVEVAPEAPPEGTSLDQEDSKVKFARHTAIMIWMGKFNQMVVLFVCYLYLYMNELLRMRQVFSSMLFRSR